MSNTVPTPRRPPGRFSSLSLSHESVVSSSSSSSSSSSGRKAVTPSPRDHSAGVASHAARANASTIVFGESSPSSAGFNRFSRTPTRSSLSGIFATLEDSSSSPSTPSSSPSRQSSAHILPGYADVFQSAQSAYKPGRRPGPRRESAPIFGSSDLAEDPVVSGRRQASGGSPNLKSNFKLVYNESELSSPVPPLNDAQKLDSSAIQAAGRRNVFATHNILNPPTTLEFAIRPASAMAMYHKHRSSVNTGGTLTSYNEPVSEITRPTRRPCSSLGGGNNSAIVFGDDGSREASLTSPSHSSRYAGTNKNKSSIIFGDDGGKPVSFSRIPVPVRKNSEVSSTAKLVSLADFVNGGSTATDVIGSASLANESDSTPESVLVSSTKNVRVDPSKVDIPAGMPSGKHLIY
ncbi:UNVERIFIED_CONTAM: hypothetical protein HDU68_003083 [Siphonaria sp. JEL0065]|nr:hypothetical protein HDU68_003083 [Siphonaria sp. JEL0065]